MLVSIYVRSKDYFVWAFWDDHCELLCLMEATLNIGPNCTLVKFPLILHGSKYLKNVFY